jgi:hypothetical protein
MIREKRLSRPGRASSRLPLSPRANSRLRLKPLLFLRPLPPIGGTPIRETPRFCTRHEYPFFDARPEGFRSSVRLRRMSSHPTARLWRKSTVCGLNRFLPSAEADGALHLNPRPPVRGSCSSASLRRAKRQLRFRFGNKNCASAHFSLQNGIQRFRERRGEQRPMAQSA